MRRLTPVLLWLVLVAACAPRMVPAPIVTVPRYPDYLEPRLSPVSAGTRQAEHQDRAWRFLQTGDLRSAQRELDLALRIDPGFTPATTTAGYVALARGEESAAVERFEGALLQDPAYVSALVGRGHALAAMGRDADAIDAYGRALANDPTLPDLQRRTDILQFRVLEGHIADARGAARGGRLDAAAAAYRTALESSPDSAFLYRELGDVEERRGNAAQALQQFERAAELDPADAASMFRIGRLREAHDDLVGAIRAYERSAALDSTPAVREALEEARGRLEFSRLPEEYRAIESAPAVTRAGLAALIGVRLAGLVQAGAAPAAVVLTDVRANWAEPWIMSVTQAGVMEGYANHTFQPDTTVPRIDLARVVAQILPRLAPPAALLSWQQERQTFTDLSASHLAYPAASTAVASGVMPGTPDGRFEPSRPVSGREAVAAIERLEALAAAPAISGSR